MNYFVDLPGYDGRELNRQECLDLMAAGELTSQTFVCAAETDTWLPASSYFQSPAPATTPATPAPQPEPPKPAPAPAQSDPAPQPPGDYLKYWLLMLAVISVFVGVFMLSEKSFIAFGVCLANAVFLVWLGFIIELLQRILGRLNRLVKLAERKN